MSWSAATDLLTEGLVHFTTCSRCSLDAAVTAIVGTPCIVVIVVTNAISLVIGQSTFWSFRILVVWVDALALQTHKKGNSVKKALISFIISV